MHKVQEVVQITNMRLTNKMFSKIFIASAHVEKLQFTSCIIESDAKCTFSTKKVLKDGKKIDKVRYNIIHLCFYDCGGERYSNWLSHNYKLKNIADGISESISLADSLKIISCIDLGEKYSVSCLHELSLKHGIKTISRN